MAKSLLAAGALCALLSTGFAATSAGAAAPQPGMPLTIAGPITSIANAGPTETLMVRRWSVTLSATTTVTMRGGAATTFAALNVGDVVRVAGTVTAATPPATYTMSANTIADESLVDHATGITGVVRSIYPSGSAYQMLILVGHRSDDGFVRSGRLLYVNLSSTTPITLFTSTPPTPTAGTISSIAAGNVVRVAGIYDAAANVLVAPDYVQVLATGAGRINDCDRDNNFCRPKPCSRNNALRCRRNLTGWLISRPGPLTLRVALVRGPIITVQTSTTSVVMRRYDGTSAVDQLPVLDQLQLGDALQLTGSFAPGSARVFNARAIEDVSLQVAYTGVTVKLTTLTQTSPTSYTGKGLVLGGRTKHSPYRKGQVLTLQFNANTAVSGGTLGDLRYHQNIHVSGLYDRHSGILIVRKAHV